MQGNTDGGRAGFDLIDQLTNEALRDFVEMAAASAEGGTTNTGRESDPFVGFIRRFLESPGIAVQLRRETPPASSRILEQLPKRVLRGSDRWLRQTRLRVEGFHGDIIAEPASFGNEEALTQGCPVQAELIAAQPIRANTPLKNASAVRGRAVICERGGCTFAKKALLCQEAGAVAVIVVQSVDIWPYVMTDSTGVGTEVSIPVIMVQKMHGQKLLQRVVSGSPRTGKVEDEGEEEEEEAEDAEKLPEAAGIRHTHKAEGPERAVVVEISSSQTEDACSVCFEPLEGEMCTQLPCRHVYHQKCIQKWLGMRNTCPTCRHELPTDDEEFNEQQRRKRNDESLREEMAHTWYS